jgi:hypothetical protein
LHELSLKEKEGDFPRGAPVETGGPGPLRLRDNVLTFSGVTIEFDGEKVVKQRYEKPARPKK